MTDSPTARLRELGLELPPAATPSFDYVPVTEHAGVRSVESLDHTLTAEFEGQDEDMARLLGSLITAGVTVQSFAEEPLRLEDVFMMITKGIVS